MLINLQNVKREFHYAQVLERLIIRVPQLPGTGSQKTLGR